MENWTVKFLVDCDNKDSRGVYRAGTTQTIREDSARFWIWRSMAVRVADAPTGKAAAKGSTAKTPATALVDAATELRQAATNLETAEAAQAQTTGQ